METDRARELWQQHRALARSYAGYFLRKFPQANAAEIFAAADEGLWDAARLHPDLSGRHFVAMAKVRVRGALLDAIRTTDWLPRRARLTYGGSFFRIFLDLSDDSNEPQRIQAELSTLPEIEAAIDERSRFRWLQAAISDLPPRDRDIITRALQGEQQRSIGQSHGISEPRVNQILARITAHLRTVLHPNQLKVPPI